MLQYLTKFLLILCLTFVNSIDRNESDYELNLTQDLNIKPQEINHVTNKQLLNEHLKIFMIIGGVSVGIMIIIATLVITLQYLRMKKRRKHQPTEQTIPLNKINKKNRI